MKFITLIVILAPLWCGVNQNYSGQPKHESGCATEPVRHAAMIGQN